MSLAPLHPTPVRKPVAITGPLSLGDLLDRAFRFLRARFVVLALTAGCVLVPIGIVSALVTGQYMTNVMDLLEFSTTATDMTDGQVASVVGGMAGFMGSVFLIFALTAVGNSFITLATTHHVERFLHGGTATVGEGLRTALGRFWALVGMQIVQGAAIGAATAAVALVVMLIFLFIVMVFGFAGALAVEAGTGDTTNVLLMIVFVVMLIVLYVALLILMVAPAAYLSARWAAAAPAVLLERLGPVTALKRSWGLSRGHMWRCLGYVVLLTLFSSLVIGIPLSMTQQVALLLMPGQMMLVAIVGTAAGYIANVLYQPIYASGIAMLYYDLRVRGEAYDVALRVAELEAEVAQDVPPA